MTHQLQGGHEGKEEEQKTSGCGLYNCVFREVNDSLYLMMKERKSKRSFQNTFSKSTLIDMDLKQPMPQICNLLETAKSGKRSEIKFKIRFGTAENDKKICINQLSKSYMKGCALYIFICVEESWLSAQYRFKLLEQKRNDMDILQDILSDLQQEIDTLKMQNMKQEPLRVSFNGQSNINQNKECAIFSSHGISKVIRDTTGKYIVYFDKRLDNNNYTVSLAANMWHTGGVIIGLEGNNRKGDKAYTQTEESFIIGTRCPRANANRDCDLIHVVVYQSH